MVFWRWAAWHAGMFMQLTEFGRLNQTPYYLSVLQKKFVDSMCGVGLSRCVKLRRSEFAACVELHTCVRMHIERSRRAGSRTALGLKSGPLTFTLFFRNNLEGLDTRAALSSRAAQAGVAKTAEGMWPPLGFKTGRYTPGSLDRACSRTAWDTPRRKSPCSSKAREGEVVAHPQGLVRRAEEGRSVGHKRVCLLSQSTANVERLLACKSG